MDSAMTRAECSAVRGGTDYRLDRIDERLDEHEKQLNKAAVIEAQQAEIIKQQDKLLADLNKRVRAIESAPSKRMDIMITACLAALGGGITTYLLSNLLK